MKIKSHLDVFNVSRRSLRKSLRSIAANVKSRKTLTGRQRRRALLIVDELRLAIKDGWSCIPRKTAEGSWKQAEVAVGHLINSVYVQSCIDGRTKFAEAVGNYVSLMLDRVLEDISFAEEKRRNRYGIEWLGSHWSNE